MTRSRFSSACQLKDWKGSVTVEAYADRNEAD